MDLECHYILLFVFWCIFSNKIHPTPLTHYQTTNFRLFQTERVCRRQFQIWRKWQKVIQTGRNHTGKRRNCSLWANFSFSHSVFKTLVSQGGQKVSLCQSGLTHYHTIPTFNDPKVEGFGKHCGKRRKCWEPAFSPFSHSVFYPIKERNHHFKRIKFVVCKGL